ncbi:hypothetical protein DFH09DRAFT_957082, partial [Mycena vulgaris]
IGDEQFVAKCFFETGRGKDQVTLEENTTNLESKLVRTENARWFLKSFRTAAEEINLVTPREVVEGDAKPSPASGITSKVWESEPTPTKKIICLLEPLRNAAVTHYTGTMEHPTGTGQLAHTLFAFVHYAFQASGGDILFADIQGINKNMGIIIFDLMIHSPDENTGVGDYGPAGIVRWRDQHDCTVFASDLGWKSVMMTKKRSSRLYSRFWILQNEFYALDCSSHPRVLS